jgi:hypothetical protein
MPKLKLGLIPDDKPVKLTIEIPASIHRDLFAYAEMLQQETGQPTTDPGKLVAPMLARFIASDRAFLKAKREHQRPAPVGGQTHPAAPVTTTFADQK